MLETEFEALKARNLEGLEKLAEQREALLTQLLYFKETDLARWQSESFAPVRATLDECQGLHNEMNSFYPANLTPFAKPSVPCEKVAMTRIFTTGSASLPGAGATYSAMTSKGRLKLVALVPITPLSDGFNDSG